MQTNHIIILTRRSQEPKDHNTNFSLRNTPPGQRNFGGQNRLNFQNRPQRNNERFRNYDQNHDYRELPGTQYNHHPPKSIDFGQCCKRRPFNRTERNDTRTYNRQVNSYQQDPFNQPRNTWEPRRNDEQRLFETGTRFQSSRTDEPQPGFERNSSEPNRYDPTHQGPPTNSTQQNSWEPNRNRVNLSSIDQQPFTRPRTTPTYAEVTLTPSQNLNVSKN